ncbi:type II toxin-antitoxin system PemK/MazF family toxin [Stieleria varia]|uniref:PemK-like protein n=1 Tax=Stieleria varia TaxID=2528005 RepID=A0A5C6B7E7_9BACT|nr:type II toxin-antitoxin system PemK/MazF family toxin [Stieleria varia]TWU08175.1 PemK-like protein [Stieleria varia]
MATSPSRGDVWLVDLGMAAKVRPCLVLSIPADDDNDRVLTTIIPHTTSTLDSRFEVSSNVRFLKPGAFDAQNTVTIPTVKLIRRLGRLPDTQMTRVEQTAKLWLGFDTGA